MPFCSKCGTEVPENTSFCSKCGNSLQSGQNSAQIKNANVGTAQNEQAQSDVWAWLLAILPIMTIVLASSIIGIFNVNDEDVLFRIWALVYCTLLLGFFIADRKELRKRSNWLRSSEQWIALWFVIFPPAGLFLRVGKTNGKYGYAITGLVLYIIFWIFLAIAD